MASEDDGDLHYCLVCRDTVEVRSGIQLSVRCDQVVKVVTRLSKL